MAVDEAHFRRAMSHFVSGVTIVTTEHAGALFGMTVASFASLSLRPPLVLVCIENSTRTHEAIAAAGKFGASILAHGQADLSSRFASHRVDRFDGVALREGILGVPLIDGALTTVECRLREQLPGGDHTIFVGEVAAVTTEDGPPLVYFRSGYHELR